VPESPYRIDKHTGGAAYSPSVPSLTTGASRALEEAQLAARWFNHPEVGTGHLLVGLVREHDGLAAQALREVGITEGPVTGNLSAWHPKVHPSGGAAKEAGKNKVSCLMR